MPAFILFAAIIARDATGTTVMTFQQIPLQNMEACINAAKKLPPTSSMLYCLDTQTGEVYKQ